MTQNFYDILGVPRDAAIEDIKKAYKKAALLHHPDKGGDTEKFKECSAALETLTDERKRMTYDAQLMRARSMDGLRNRHYERESSVERARGSSAAPPPVPRPAPGPASARTAAPSRPPRPPPTGAVEIPSDPSVLSIKELKELLTNLGIDHEGCLEKSDLLEKLRQRKERRTSGSSSGAAGEDGAPRTGGSQGPPVGTPRERASAAPPRPPPTTGHAATGTAAGGSAPSSGQRALRVKLLSLGSSAVGKSTLIKRYCEGRFVQKYITTIGIDYGVKPVKVLGHDLKVNFFDTSGGTEFQDIRVEFYTDTNAALLVYDVTSRKSFQELEDWLIEAKRHRCNVSKLHCSGNDVPCLVALCANKTDLPRRQVPTADGEQFAAKHGMRYFETSAATGDAVMDAMTFLFEGVVYQHLDACKRLGAG